MKLIHLAFLLALVVNTAHARLGETREQTEARYGLPKSEKVPKDAAPLMEGARELTFHYEGFRIKCALLLASDGVEYIVRQEYSRLVGREPITEIEREAILAAEENGQAWTKPQRNAKTPKPSRFITALSGIIWTRADGAVAVHGGGGSRVRLELPHAVQWETQFAAVKEQEARAAVPKF